tara:strand:+ start:631 stop:753 length:123 start_codon:yes stop_codon:yes gene_type:complete
MRTRRGADKQITHEFFTDEDEDADEVLVEVEALAEPAEVP